MLHLFWCRKCKRGCSCFTQNKFKRASSKVSEATRERGVFRNLVLWKWLFHNIGEINFLLKFLADVHVYLSCMLLSCNFTKKRTTSFSIFNILSTFAEQHFCTRSLNGCLVTLQYHFWSQSQ